MSAAYAANFVFWFTVISPNGNAKEFLKKYLKIHEILCAKNQVKTYRRAPSLQHLFACCSTAKFIAGI
jgi:hypothetical protein